MAFVLAAVGLAGALGGEKKQVKIKIANALDNYVTNTLENVVKIATESSVKVSSTVLQEQIATIKNESSGTNVLILKNVQILDGGKFSLSQQNDISTTVSAIFNIIQNTELVTQMQQSISNDVMNTLNQNAELQNDVRNTAYVNAASATSGEANALLDTLSDVFDFTPSSTEVSQTIQNEVRNTLNNITKNTTDVSSFLETIISTNVTQRTINDCFKSTNAYNITSLDSVIISGANSTFDVTQKNIIKSYFSCFISSTLSTKVLQDVSLDIFNKSTTITDQGIDVANIIDNEAYADVSDKKTSWMDNIAEMVKIAAVCALIGGVALAIVSVYANKNKKCIKQSKLNKKAPGLSNPGNLPICKSKKGKKGKKDKKATINTLNDSESSLNTNMENEPLNTEDVPELPETKGEPQGNTSTAIKYLKHFF